MACRRIGAKMKNSGIRNVAKRRRGIRRRIGEWHQRMAPWRRRRLAFAWRRRRRGGGLSVGQSGMAARIYGEMAWRRRT
jgi:hypothetical protein